MPLCCCVNLSSVCVAHFCALPSKGSALVGVATCWRRPLSVTHTDTLNKHSQSRTSKDLLRSLRLRNIYAQMALQHLADHVYIAGTHRWTQQYVSQCASLMHYCLGPLTSIDADSACQGQDVAWANMTQCWQQCFLTATQNGTRPKDTEQWVVVQKSLEAEAKQLKVAELREKISETSGNSDPVKGTKPELVQVLVGLQLESRKRAEEKELTATQSHLEEASERFRQRLKSIKEEATDAGDVAETGAGATSAASGAEAATVATEASAHATKDLDEEHVWRALREQNFVPLNHFMRRPWKSDATEQPHPGLAVSRQIALCQIATDILANQQHDLGVETLAYKPPAKAVDPEDYADFKGQLLTHGMLLDSSGGPAERSGDDQDMEDVFGNKRELVIKLHIRGTLLPANFPSPKDTLLRVPDAGFLLVATSEQPPNWTSGKPSGDDDIVLVEETQEQEPPEGAPAAKAQKVQEDGAPENLDKDALATLFDDVEAGRHPVPGTLRLPLHMVVSKSMRQPGPWSVQHLSPALWLKVRSEKQVQRAFEKYEHEAESDPAVTLTLESKHLDFVPSTMDTEAGKALAACGVRLARIESHCLQAMVPRPAADPSDSEAASLRELWREALPWEDEPKATKARPKALSKRAVPSASSSSSSGQGEAKRARLIF